MATNTKADWPACRLFGADLPANVIAALKEKVGKPITPKEKPAASNVVDLMEALRRSVGQEQAANASKAKKPKRAASGQKEMLLPIAGKKPVKEATAKKPTARSQRKSA